MQVLPTNVRARNMLQLLLGRLNEGIDDLVEDFSVTDDDGIARTLSFMFRQGPVPPAYILEGAEREYYLEQPIDWPPEEGDDGLVFVLSLCHLALAPNAPDWAMPRLLVVLREALDR